MGLTGPCVNRLKAIDVLGYGGWFPAPGSTIDGGFPWMPVEGTPAFTPDAIPILPGWIADLIRPPPDPVYEPTALTDSESSRQVGGRHLCAHPSGGGRAGRTYDSWD